MDQYEFGIVKELEEEKQDYKKGIQEGKTMAFCEEDQKIPNVKKVKLVFEYIQPLQVFLNQFWKLELQPMIDKTYLAINELQNTDDGYAQLFSFINENVYIWTMKLIMGKPITYVKSPTHSILNKLVYNLHKTSYIFPQIWMIQKISNLIKGLNYYFPQNILMTLVQYLAIQQKIQHICTNNDALQHIKYCTTLNLISKFNEFSIDDAYQSYIYGFNLPSQTQIQRGIFLFFIDRNLSTRHQKIKRTKQVLIVFLKSLQEDYLFNIISFGGQVKKSSIKHKLQQNNKGLNYQNIKIERIQIIEIYF
ncbi:unnamed protein product [Paramecium primaurelia]|uniref:Uncharacterized protein n=1 Tax=Paramecium primaurelia TaxID=5886 RepID=A0A8S1Q6T5_PARPR|nr:unnamed protein product [Paramecium primaurelia]